MWKKGWKVMPMLQTEFQLTVSRVLYVLFLPNRMPVNTKGKRMWESKNNSKVSILIKYGLFDPENVS